MAHNLATKNDGTAMMMYAGGETPWHGLGTRLEKLATAEEAIKAAGLDWEVEKRPVFHNGPSGPLKAGDFEAVVRKDTQDTLGMVKGVFQPLQNREAFSFMDAIVGEKLAIYETAGALGRGERVWLLAKLPGILRIGKGDEIEKFVLLAHGHDGSLKVHVRETGVRVVCQNTLNVALNDGSARRVSMLHTANLGMRLEEVREAIGIVSSKLSFLETAGQKLATVQLTQDAFKSYLTRVGIAPENPDTCHKVALKAMEEVSALFDGGQKGANLKTSKGTAWGAYNAIVEYVDFHRPARATKLNTAQDIRTESVLFGSGLKLKQKAWDEALVLAK
jgi:phage/plasmid-like protein (TIGR03299 family)